MSDRLLPGAHSRLPSASFLRGSPRPGSPSARVTDCSARSTRFPKSARPAVRATADEGDREGCDCERRTQADPEAVVGEDLAPFMAAVSRTLILQGCMTWCSAESKVLCGVAAGPWERRRDGAAEQNEGPDPHRSVCLPAGIHGRERPHRGRGVRKHTRAHATTGASKGGGSRPRSRGPSGHVRSGRGPARRSRTTASAAARVRISGGPRCALTPYVVCAVQRWHDTCADHRNRAPERRTVCQVLACRTNPGAGCRRTCFSSTTLRFKAA